MSAHHAPDDMLIAYAAGVLDASESLLLACHLTLCPECRAAVEDAETVGAALLAGAESAPVPGEISRRVPDAMLDTLLARLDDPAALEPPMVDPRGIVPAPLFALVGDLDAAPWRRMFPGLHMLDVPAQGAHPFIKLIRVDPGTRVPMHDHAGFEGSLVLTGGFTDDQGHYERGDLCLRDESQGHEQLIDRGEPCVWLVVADGKHIPRTFTGWLARIFMGL